VGIEIERKFLVCNQDWKVDAHGQRYTQGYLSTDPDRVVRVRLAGDQAWLTIKNRAVDLVRAEFEYPIPPYDARILLEQLCLGPLIDKTRYRVADAGHIWEVDEFHGDNSGLVVAEIELSRPDEPFERPVWLGDEVSGDPRYGNSSLIAFPFSTWE